MLDYEENFYGLQGAESDSGIRWETLWQEWFIFALQQCGYTDISQLPQLNLSCQVLLSGLLIMADWIASNTTYFPLLALDDSGHTLPYPLRTQEAWAQLSLPDKWEPTLFSMDSETFHHRFGFVFNSVQQTVLQTVEQSYRPGIHISETQMEVGKTEAALGAAELLASKMGCGGIFFGLPTQATSNGIFPRLKQWAQQHGIRLAHGMSQLNEDYTALFCGHATQNEDDDATGLIARRWFEGRKQALLSDFVIGTVDQLLMATLKQKHLMLRHLGLHGKVVIIDECHAYDTYMNRYLDRALNWLGTYHVPVILLSATLPARRRTELILAYQNRHAAVSSDLSWQVSQAYPLLTWTDGPDVFQHAIPIDTPSHSVRIRIGTAHQIQKYVASAITQGGCIGVIVNTVNQEQVLAQLRRGIGHTLGDIPQLWRFFLGDLPEEMLGETEPSRAEWALYAALTLFALHQQVKDPVGTWMSQTGMGLGTAMSKLIQQPEDEKRIPRRFHLLATSSNMVELTHHMRSIVQLLRSSSIPLDYLALAQDLYCYQTAHTVASVRLRWGQDFYRRTIVKSTEITYMKGASLCI